MGKTVVLLGSLLFASSSALAQPPVVITKGAVPTEVVSFADLNINSKVGQDRLAHRIRSAAEDICLTNNKEDVAVDTSRHHCFWVALNGGLAEMHNAMAESASGAPLASATLTVSAR